MSDLQAVEAFYQSVLGSQPHLPEELLLSAAEDRLSPREQSRIEAHLAACARCRQDFAALCHFAAQQPSAPAPTLVVSTPEVPTEPLSEAPPTLRVVEASARVEPTPLSVPISEPLKSTPEPRAGLTRSVLLSGLFLGLSALGWGVLYGKLAPRTTAPTVALPAPSAAPSPAPDLARLQAAYERERAQLKGRVAQLEKQLKGQGAPLAAPRNRRPPRSGTLFSPDKLPVDRGPVSLSVHPIVSWKALPKVHHYAAELVDNKGKALVKTRTSLPEWRITTALARGKSYRWKITPQDRTDKPLGKPLKGTFRVASDDEAKRLRERLLALASELGKLNFTGDAQALKARAATIAKK